MGSGPGPGPPSGFIFPKGSNGNPFIKSPRLALLSCMKNLLKYLVTELKLKIVVQNIHNVIKYFLYPKNDIS
jgi:hypothetical protein